MDQVGKSTDSKTENNSLENPAMATTSEGTHPLDEIIAVVKAQRERYQKLSRTSEDIVSSGTDLTSGVLTNNEHSMAIRSRSQRKASFIRVDYTDDAKLSKEENDKRRLRKATEEQMGKEYADKLEEIQARIDAQSAKFEASVEEERPSLSMWTPEELKRSNSQVDTTKLQREFVEKLCKSDPKYAHLRALAVSCGKGPMWFRMKEEREAQEAAAKEAAQAGKASKGKGRR